MPLKQSPKHFLDIAALDGKTLRAILDLASSIKRKAVSYTHLTLPTILLV